MKVTNTGGVTYEISDAQATQLAAMQAEHVIKVIGKDSLKTFEWWTEQLKEVLLSGKWSK